MAYKFCENHLSELYEAIKEENIEKIEKIEHELTTQEECVACTYAFKAKGDAREALVSFLKEEGFNFNAGENKKMSSSIYLFVRFLIFGVSFAFLALTFSRLISLPLAIAISVFASVGLVILYMQTRG